MSIPFRYFYWNMILFLHFFLLAEIIPGKNISSMLFVNTCTSLQFSKLLALFPDFVFNTPSGIKFCHILGFSQRTGLTPLLRWALQVDANEERFVLNAFYSAVFFNFSWNIDDVACLFSRRSIYCTCECIILGFGLAWL